MHDIDFTPKIFGLLPLMTSFTVLKIAFICTRRNLLDKFRILYKCIYDVFNAKTTTILVDAAMPPQRTRNTFVFELHRRVKAVNITEEGVQLKFLMWFLWQKFVLRKKTRRRR